MGSGCNGAGQSSPMSNSKAKMQVCFAVDANVLLAASLAMNGRRWVLNIIIVFFFQLEERSLFIQTYMYTTIIRLMTLK